MSNISEYLIVCETSGIQERISEILLKRKVIL